MNHEKRITFKHGQKTSELNLDDVDFICIPSKAKYSEIGLCLKNKNSISMSLQIGSVDCSQSLSFKDRQKIGYEIERRCSQSPSIASSIEDLYQKCRDEIGFTGEIIDSNNDFNSIYVEWLEHHLLMDKVDS